MKTQNLLSSLAAHFLGAQNTSQETASAAVAPGAAVSSAQSEPSRQPAFEQSPQAPATSAGEAPRASFRSCPGVEILGVELWTQQREFARQKGREKTVSARDLVFLNLLRGLPAERGFSPLSPRKWTDGRQAWSALAIALDGLDMHLAELAKIAAGARPLRAWIETSAKSLFAEAVWSQVQKDASALERLAALSSEARKRIRQTQAEWAQIQSRGEELPPEARVSEAPARPKKEPFAGRAPVSAQAAPNVAPAARDSSASEGGAHGL